MKTQFGMFVLSAILAMAPRLQAAGVKELFSGLPGDAVAVVAVPDIGRLDADFGQMATQIGLDAIIPPQFSKPSAVVRQFLSASEAFDDNGSIAVVVLNASNPFEFQQKMALLIPTTKGEALLENMGGQRGEEGVWNVTISGEPSFAATVKNHVAVGPTADVVKAIAKSEKTLTVSASDLVLLEDMDLVVWIDADRLLKVLRPQIDGFLGMMMMMQAQQGAFASSQAAASKKQLDTMLDGSACWMLGLGLDESGLTIRVGGRNKPGSELAKIQKVRTRREALVSGLPAENYLLAIGQTVDPDVSREGMKMLDPYFDAGERLSGIDKESFSRLRQIAGEIIPLGTGMRVVAHALSPGTNGVVGLALVVDTTDSQKWFDLVTEGIGAARKAFANLEVDDGQAVAQAFSALKHTADAEEIAGAHVHHVTFNPASLNEEGEEDNEWSEQLEAIVGEEGLLVRIAAVNGKEAVLTLGGGKGYAEKIIKSVKNGDGSMASDAGIQSVATGLPKDRYLEGYAAVDRLLKCISDVMEAIDEERLPVSMPTVREPLTLRGTGGKNWTRMDVFLSTDLMKATKNALMAMMGTMAKPMPASGS